MDQNKMHMTTGEFARLCDTTKDTLFHYDRIGLLKPDTVGENGYRLYSLNQYYVFSVIWLLKEAGTPLAQIRDYMENQEAPQFLALLKENRQRVEGERIKLDKMLAQIQDYIKATEEGIAIKGKESCPRLEECQEQLLVITPLPERQSDEDFVMAADEHFRYCGEKGLEVKMTLGCVHRQETLREQPDRLDYYCSCLMAEGGEGKPSPVMWLPDRERLHVRPKGTYAVLEHCGSYETMGVSFRRLLAYIEEQGLVIAGCGYETDLLNFLGTANPEDYIVRIEIQVEP